MWSLPWLLMQAYPKHRLSCSFQCMTTGHGAHFVTSPWFSTRAGPYSVTSNPQRSCTSISASCAAVRSACQSCPALGQAWMLLCWRCWKPACRSTQLPGQQQSSFWLWIFSRSSTEALCCQVVWLTEPQCVVSQVFAGDVAGLHAGACSCQPDSLAAFCC